MNSKFYFVLPMLLLAGSPAHAGFSCQGPLTDSQAEGFKHLFSPAYEPSLTHIGGAISPENMSKKLPAAEIAALTVDKPIVATSRKLNQAGSDFLKSALNDNAQSTVPGWLSTVIGAFVPAAWIGISADVMLQLVNGAGDAGRLTLANIAGTVSTGGNVAVVQRIAKGSGGSKFIWAYTYTAMLNNKATTTLLYVCSADVVQAG